MVHNSQMWGGLFWLAIAVFVTFQGRSLGLGTLNDPGSGFALFWIGLIMSGLSIAVIVTAITRGSETLASLWRGTRWEKVLIVTSLLVIFGFLFERLGFIVCSVALLLVLMLFIDPLPVHTAVLISVLSTFLVWTVMGEVLQIQMPAGILAGAPEDALRMVARWLIRAIATVIGVFTGLIGSLFR